MDFRKLSLGFLSFFEISCGLSVWKYNCDYFFPLFLVEIRVPKIVGLIFSFKMFFNNFQLVNGYIINLECFVVLALGNWRREIAKTRTHDCFSQSFNLLISKTIGQPSTYKTHFISIIRSFASCVDYLTGWRYRKALLISFFFKDNHISTIVDGKYCNTGTLFC